MERATRLAGSTSCLYAAQVQLQGPVTESIIQLQRDSLAVFCRCCSYLVQSSTFFSPLDILEVQNWAEEGNWEGAMRGASSKVPWHTDKLVFSWQLRKKKNDGKSHLNEGWVWSGKWHINDPAAAPQCGKKHTEAYLHQRLHEAVNPLAGDFLWH